MCNGDSQTVTAFVPADPTYTTIVFRRLYNGIDKCRTCHILSSRHERGNRRSSRLRITSHVKPATSSYSVTHFLSPHPHAFRRRPRDEELPARRRRRETRSSAALRRRQRAAGPAAAARLHPTTTASAACIAGCRASRSPAGPATALAGGPRQAPSNGSRSTRSGHQRRRLRARAWRRPRVRREARHRGGLERFAEEDGWERCTSPACASSFSGVCSASCGGARDTASDRRFEANDARRACGSRGQPPRRGVDLHELLRRPAMTRRRSSVCA